MASCNAKVSSAFVSGANCTVNIELRVNEAAEAAVRAFRFEFPTVTPAATVKALAKARIQEEWEAYLASAALKATADTLVSQLVGASFNLTW